MSGLTQKVKLGRSHMSIGHLGLFFGGFANIGLNEIVGFTGVSICLIAVAVSWVQIRRDAQNQPN
jgi:hypothetical protein